MKGEEIQGPDEELRGCLQDLEAAQSELDAFLYSVSHDLGAPMRAIQGFSRILLKRYSDILDEKGKDYLGRMEAASRRIEQMVGDLTQMSRLSKVVMKIEELDLSRIVHRIADRLGRSDKERKVKFTMAEGIRAYGDAHLLAIGLENLLANAWKFTGGKEDALVEFGVEPRAGGERIYFVRDNGIGFDMINAERLFKPFQKLHDEREFPGSGVGLATVYRIIRRSGGKIWAESEEGIGTTIYFTLG